METLKHLAKRRLFGTKGQAINGLTNATADGLTNQGRVRNLADRSSRRTQNSASETQLSVRRLRPVVTAEYAPQTIGLRTKARNSRGIVRAGNPGRFARTTWWCAQSCETSLPQRDPG
jgi:hypothetical protein